MPFAGVLLVIAAELFLASSSYHDYCYGGEINGAPTTCLYSRKSIVSVYDMSQKHISVLKTVGLSEKNKQILLDEHNKYRQKVARGHEHHSLNGASLPLAKNMTTLKWSPVLEKVASLIASDCLDVTHVDKIEYSYGDSATASINLAREDVANDKFSLKNYSVLNLFKQWTDYVSLFNPSIFNSKRVDKLKREVYEYANLIHDRNFKIGCSFASIKVVYDYYKPQKHTQLLYCAYRPGAPKHRMPYEPKVN